MLKAQSFELYGNLWTDEVNKWFARWAIVRIVSVTEVTADYAGSAKGKQVLIIGSTEANS